MFANWAERYLAAEPELQKFQPFTSEDIAKSQHEKIQRFRAQQLEQGYKKSKGISP